MITHSLLPRPKLGTTVEFAFHPPPHAVYTLEMAARMVGNTTVVTLDGTEYPATITEAHLVTEAPPNETYRAGCILCQVTLTA